MGFAIPHNDDGGNYNGPIDTPTTTTTPVTSTSTTEMTTTTP